MVLTVVIWSLGIIALNILPIFDDYNLIFRAFASGCFGWTIASYVNLHYAYDVFKDSHHEFMKTIQDKYK